MVDTTTEWAAELRRRGASFSEPTTSETVEDATP